MRKITIIGAGQAGLQLGIGLVDQGYDVTIVTNRSGEEIAAGRVMSSQSMYNMALSFERELGLSLWDDSCPPTDGVHIRAGQGEAMMVDWRAKMTAPGQSVDQRIKMPRWMEEFQKRGGKLLLLEADVDALEQFAADSDLVIVATGKGEIGKLFERDDSRCVFDKPQRSVALTYVHGMAPREDYSALNINLSPGIGEYVNFPCLTLSGPADIINLEAIPGGPMDRWDEVDNPEDLLALSLEMIATYFPWERERCENVSLTDSLGTLAGRVPIFVRKPVATLPSGATVLGMADVVVLNDPVTGQGSNNASKCAKVYMDAILAQGESAFDDAWKQQTFEKYWDYAQWVVKFTNSHLMPPLPSMLNVFTACAENPALAARVANAFDDPKGLVPWYYDEAEAATFIQSYSA